MALHNVHDIPQIVDLDIGGVTPFWSAPDAADECLVEAHAILTFMSAAYNVSEGLGDKEFTGVNDGLTYENAIRTLRAEIKGGALRGVARLIATAQYLNDIARHERRSAA